MTGVGGPAAVGIDFGTTHTVVSVATADGRVQPVLFDSSPLLSSAVYAGDDRLLVGRDAERSARLDPSRFEPNPKRRIDEGTILLGEREFAIVEVIGAVLRRALDEANRVAGGPTANTMLTYPATWSGPRRKLLVDAAARAGAGHVVLIPEPVAAAVYFSTVLRHEVPVGSALVVYDLGGGTFDTSIVRRVPGGGFEVAASAGLDGVGGLDLDAVIVDRLGQTLSTTDPARWARLVEQGEPADRRHQRALWDEARAAKEQLSRASSAAVRVPLFDTDTFVTREEFERGARPLLERTVELTASTVASAGLRRDQVAGLFLVGGSSRIPLVATLLHQRFGLAPTLIEQPELVVSLGSIAAARGAPGVAAAPVAPPPLPAPASPAAAVSPAAVGLGAAGVGLAAAGLAGAAPAPASAPPGGASTPVSGVPISGLPVSASPVSGSPISGVPAPVTSAMGAPGLPAGPYPPVYASIPVKSAGSFGRRLLLIGAAALVVLLLVGVGAAKALTVAFKNSGSQSSTSGNGRRATSGNGANGSVTGGGATGTGKPHGNAGPDVTVGKTVWYAGLKITFGKVTYDATASPPQVTAETLMENLGDKDVNPDVPVVFSTGGQSYEGGARESTTVASGQKSNIHLDFDVRDQLAGSLAEGTFTVGRGDEAQAVVPVTGGKLVAYEPRNVLKNIKLTQRDLNATFTTCDLHGGFFDYHGQAKKGNEALTCSVDLQYTGGSSMYVGTDNFRLGLPDGTEIGPTVGPNEAMYSAAVVPNTPLGFMIKWPAPGTYILRLVNVHSNEKRSAANVVEYTITL